MNGRSQNISMIPGHVGMKEQKAICVIEANTVSIFSADGKDYTTALPFPVSWMIPSTSVSNMLIILKNHEFHMTFLLHTFYLGTVLNNKQTDLV